MNATASSGLAITYKSLTPNVCYILSPSAGTAVQAVSPFPVGNTTCTIEASQAGNSTWAAATPVSRSFLWKKAVMIITPYYSTNATRNSSLLSTNAVTYAANTSYNFVSSLLYASGQNSGLASIGHLLSAVSVTPTVCTVENVAIQDRGSLFTWASVKMLAKSTCTVRWSFAGNDYRAPATRDMSVLVSK